MVSQPGIPGVDHFGHRSYLEEQLKLVCWFWFSFSWGTQHSASCYFISYLMPAWLLEFLLTSVNELEGIKLAKFFPPQLFISGAVTLYFLILFPESLFACFFLGGLYLEITSQIILKKHIGWVGGSEFSPHSLLLTGYKTRSRLYHLSFGCPHW